MRVLYELLTGKRKTLTREELRKLYFSSSRIAGFLEELHARKLISYKMLSNRRVYPRSVQHFLTSKRYDDSIKADISVYSIDSEIIKKYDILRIEDDSIIVGDNYKVPIIGNLILCTFTREMTEEYLRRVFSPSVLKTLDIDKIYRDYLILVHHRTSTKLYLSEKRMFDGDIGVVIKYNETNLVSNNTTHLSITGVVKRSELPIGKHEFNNFLKTIEESKIVADIISGDYRELSYSLEIKIDLVTNTRRFNISLFDFRGTSTFVADKNSNEPGYIKYALNISDVKRLVKEVFTGEVNTDIRSMDDKVEITVSLPKEILFNEYLALEVEKRIKTRYHTAFVAPLIFTKPQSRIVDTLLLAKPTSKTDVVFYAILGMLESARRDKLYEEDAVEYVAYYLHRAGLQKLTYPVLEDLSNLGSAIRNMVEKGAIEIRNGELYYKNEKVREIIASLDLNYNIYDDLVSLIEVSYAASINEVERRMQRRKKAAAVRAQAISTYSM